MLLVVRISRGWSDSIYPLKDINDITGYILGRQHAKTPASIIWLYMLLVVRMSRGWSSGIYPLEDVYDITAHSLSGQVRMSRG